MDLEDYRKEIDRVNREVVDSVSRRMNIVEEIGDYKKQNGMEIKDEGREEVVKQQFEKLSKKKRRSSKTERPRVPNYLSRWP